MLRWGELNGTVLDRQGEVGEGTSIDFEEPVVITIQCDADGWVMQVSPPDVSEQFLSGSNSQVNEDLAFPHYLHMVDHTKVVQINII